MGSSVGKHPKKSRGCRRSDVLVKPQSVPHGVLPAIAPSSGAGSKDVDIDCHDLQSTTNTNNAHNRYSGSDYNIAESVAPCANISISTGGDLQILKLKFGVDKKAISVDEKSASVLKYKTPHFRANATVEIPALEAGRKMQVGWIQVCTQMDFINVYGSEGLTSWEFPEMTTGKYEMVSDADGQCFPWYGKRHEVQMVVGPTRLPTPVTVHMNDNFFPQVTWYVPADGHTRQPKLTHVYRRQKFISCLAICDSDDTAGADGFAHPKVLKSIVWHMEVEIEVAPESPLGQRARVVTSKPLSEPYALDDENNNCVLKTYAMKPPNANSSQLLVWRPNIGPSSVVVKPVRSTVDTKAYLETTKDYLDDLLAMFNRNRTSLLESTSSVVS